MLAIQDIEKDIKINLERIIARSKRDDKKILKNSFGLGDSLFIGYFMSNVSSKQLNEAVNMGADVFTLTVIDYFQRFGGTVSESNKFIKPKKEDAINYFANYLSNKEYQNYKNGSQDEGAGISGVESEIVSSFYLSLIRDERSKNLIRKTRNMNDLKAILLIDSILPYLKNLNGVFEEDLNPEQLLIKLAKSWSLECPTVKRTYEHINDISKHYIYINEKIPAKINRIEPPRGVFSVINKYFDKLTEKYNKIKEVLSR